MSEILNAEQIELLRLLDDGPSPGEIEDVLASHEALRSRERELRDALAAPSNELIQAVESGVYAAVSCDAPSTRQVAKDAIAAVARALLGVPSTPEPARCPTCGSTDPRRQEWITPYTSHSYLCRDPWHTASTPEEA
jgi:hypothetical protein